MKKVISMIAIITLVVYLFGALFKVMHWPGAGWLITVSSLIFTVLILVWVFMKKRDFFELILALFFLVVIMENLWAIQHWPGQKTLLWAAVVLGGTAATWMIARKD